MNSTKVLKLSHSYEFYSSGSVAKPSLIVHARSHIQREIQYLADRFSCRRRILSAVPVAHIYGYLWAVLLPEILRLQTLDLRALGPTAIRPGDLIVGYPNLWPRLNLSWPPDVWAVNSGAAVISKDWARLCANGLERWCDVYGSTETAGLGWRSSPALPFELFPYWNDYLDATVSPDHLDWIDARHFLLLGRKDHAVQVSGINVYPQQIERVLREHSKIQQVAVRMMRPEQGKRLKAYVVGDISEPEIRAWAQSRLDGPERPMEYTFGEALPCSPSGKPSDW